MRQAENEVMNVSGYFEGARSINVFLRLQQYVKGNGCGIRLRLVTAATIVHQINLYAALALRAPAGAAG